MAYGWWLRVRAISLAAFSIEISSRPWGSTATSMAPEERAVAPSARRTTTTLAPARAAESAAIAPAMPAPMTSTSAIDGVSVQVPGAQVDGSIELLLSQRLSPHHRALHLKARVEEPEQLAMRLPRRQPAFAREQSRCRTGALRALARPHPEPAPAPQIGEVSDVFLAQAIDRFRVAGLLTGAQ